MTVRDAQFLCYQMPFEERVVDILHCRLFGRVNSKPWRKFSTFDLVCVSVSCDPIEAPKYIYVAFDRAPRSNWLVRFLNGFGRFFVSYWVARILINHKNATAFFRTRQRVDYNMLPLDNLELIGGRVAGPKSSVVCGHKKQG